MLSAAGKWPAQAAAPSSWTPIATSSARPPQQHHQLSTSLSEELLFEHDAYSEEDSDAGAAVQQQDDDACCSEASGHSLHFSFDDAPHTPATFAAWDANVSDEDLCTPGVMRMVSTSTADEAHFAASPAPRSPDAEVFLHAPGRTAHPGAVLPATRSLSSMQPHAAAVPMPFTGWDDSQLPRSGSKASFTALTATISAADAASYGTFTDGSVPRSCPRPISMPIQASRPGHTHKPSTDALDDLFVPPHLVSASHVLDAGTDDARGFSVQNPSSMRLRGSQMSKLRAGVLRSTGYFEGLTELGASTRGSSLACGRGGFL